MYVRDDFATDSEVTFQFSNGVIESIGVYISSLNLLVLNTYRQPNDVLGKHRSTSEELKPLIKALDEYLETLSSPTPDIIFCGDLNLPNAVWSNGSCLSGTSTDEKVMVEDIFNLTVSHFMTQTIDCATHRKGNTLDILFSNNIDLVHSYTPIYSGLSDHYIMEFNVDYQNQPKTESTEQNTSQPKLKTSFRDLNFFSEDINWEVLNQSFESHNWTHEFRRCTPDRMMSKFCDTVLDIASDHVPLRRSKNTVSGTRNKIPRERRTLMRTRRRINIQLSKSISETKRNNLKTKRIEIEKSLQHSYHTEASNREKRAVECIKTNSKYFYSYVKRFSKVRIGIGPLIDASKTLISAPLKMAELLSQQYSSVFSQPKFPSGSAADLFPDSPDGNVPEKPQCSKQKLSDVIFTETDFVEAIEELKPNSAAGPDDFPASLLINCRHALAKPLYIIWRRSMNSGVIPAACKLANIVPIHKGKSKAEAKNYRPVALTSLLIKIFEKVIRKQLVSFMDEHNLFNQSQHGFRSGRSCLSQLLSHFDLITRLLEDGNSVDIIYLDFAKAFDKVDIGLILRKLKFIGINGRLGRWLHTFLLNRSQSVLVDGHKSASAEVKSGVPQGSVLGPLLFLILIGDIDENVSTSFISSFADDTRVGHAFSTDQDTRQLQADLQAVYRWAKENNMEFNSDKFEHLHYSQKPNEALLSEYKSDTGSPIITKTSARDLGIEMSSSARFSDHIKAQCGKIKSKIGWILRTFRTRELDPMLSLWKQLILCDHDYCSQLWNPEKTGDIQSLELLQRSFFQKVPVLKNLTYWEQLKRVRMYSLERRRERYIALYTWKILEGLAPNLSDGANGITPKWSDRRGRECKVPHVRTQAPMRIQTIRRASFGIKGPRLFNCLPKHIRNLRGVTVDVFKSNLDKFLSTIPDEPLIPGYTSYRRVNSNSILDWVSACHRTEEVAARATAVQPDAEASTTPP